MLALTAAASILANIDGLSLNTVAGAITTLYTAKEASAETEPDPKPSTSGESSLDPVDPIIEEIEARAVPAPEPEPVSLSDEFAAEATRLAANLPPNVKHAVSYIDKAMILWCGKRCKELGMKVHHCPSPVGREPAALARCTQEQIDAYRTYQFAAMSTHAVAHAAPDVTAIATTAINALAAITLVGLRLSGSSVDDIVKLIAQKNALMGEYNNIKDVAHTLAKEIFGLDLGPAANFTKSLLGLIERGNALTIIAMQDVYRDDNFMRMDLFLKDVENAITTARSIKDANTSPAYNLLMSTYNKVKEMLDTAKRQRLMSGHRQEPVVIHLSGPPGSGKTYFATYLRERISAELNISPAAYSCNLNADDGFWASYCGEKWLVVDEFMASTDDRLVKQFNGLASTGPYQMQGASLAAKEQWAQHEFIIVMSNTDRVQLPGMYLEAAAAFFTRLPTVRVRFPQQNPEDPRAAAGRAPDCSHLRLDRVWYNQIGGAYRLHRSAPLSVSDMIRLNVAQWRRNHAAFLARGAGGPAFARIDPPQQIPAADPPEALVHSGLSKGPFTVHLNGDMGSGKSYFSDNNLHSYYGVLYRMPIVTMPGENMRDHRKAVPAIYVFDDVLTEDNMTEYMAFWDSLSSRDVVWLISNIAITDTTCIRKFSVGYLTLPYRARRYLVGMKVGTHQGFLRRIGVHGLICSADSPEITLDPAEVHGCYIRFSRKGLATTTFVQQEGVMTETTSIKDSIAAARAAHVASTGSFVVTYNKPILMTNPDVQMHATTFAELASVISSESALISAFTSTSVRFTASQRAFDAFVSRDARALVYDGELADGAGFDATARHYAQVLQRSGARISASIRAGSALATYQDGHLNITGTDANIEVTTHNVHSGIMTIILSDGVAISASQTEWIARLAGEASPIIDSYPGGHVVAALTYLDFLSSTGADPLVDARLSLLRSNYEVMAKTAHLKIASDILEFAKKHTFLMAVLVLGTVGGALVALYHAFKSEPTTPSAGGQQIQLATGTIPHTDMIAHHARARGKTKVKSGAPDDYDAEQITRSALRGAKSIEERRDYIHGAKEFADLGRSCHDYYQHCERERKPLRYSEYEEKWGPKSRANAHSAGSVKHGQPLPTHQIANKFNDGAVVVTCEIGRHTYTVFGLCIGGNEVLTVAHAAPAGHTRLGVIRTENGVSNWYQARVHHSSMTNELALLVVDDPNWKAGHDLTKYLVGPADDVITSAIAVRPATDGRPLQLVPMSCTNLDAVFSNINSDAVAKVDYHGHGMISIYTGGQGPHSLTKGDCGSPLLSSEPHRQGAVWGGLYVGELGSSAFFIPVHRVMIEAIRPVKPHASIELNLGGRQVHVDHRTAGLITQKPDPIFDFSEELEGIGGILGYTPTFHAHERKNEKPCRVSTGMDPALIPSTKRPCPTAVSDVKNKSAMTPVPGGKKKGDLNLLYSNASGQFAKKRSVGRRYYEHVLPEFLLSLPPSAFNARRKTLHEVLNGTNPSDPYYSVRGSIDVDTSPGIFYEHYFAMHDKRLFFRGHQTADGWEVDRPLVVDTSRKPGAVLMERLRLIGDLAREGRTLACLAKTFQKRELVTHQKADDGKVRTCETMDFAFNLWIAMLIGDIMERRQFDRTGQHMVIGADFKTEGTWMMQHLKEYNADEVCAADVPKWDRHTHSDPMEFAVRAAGECALKSPNYEDKEHLPNEIDAAVQYFIRCISVLGDAVYWIAGRMPTGINFTAHVNTDGHCLMLRAGAAERYERLMGHLPVQDVFGTSARAFLYGDDMIIAVKRHAYWLLGAGGIVDIYQRAGYEPTNDKKDGPPVMTPYSEASFCSRYFIPDGKITHMAIKQSTIANWLHWTSSDDPDVIAANFRVALEESIQWGPEFFTEVQNAVRTVAVPRRLNVRFYTHACGAAYLKRKVAGREAGSLESMMIRDETTVDLGAQPTEELISIPIAVHCSSKPTMTTTQNDKRGALLAQYLGIADDDGNVREMWCQRYSMCACKGLFQGVPANVFKKVTSLTRECQDAVLGAFSDLTTHRQEPSVKLIGESTDMLTALTALMEWASAYYGGPVSWDANLSPYALVGAVIGDDEIDPAWRPYVTQEKMPCRRALRDGRPYDGVPESTNDMLMTRPRAINVSRGLEVLLGDVRFGDHAASLIAATRFNNKKRFDFAVQAYLAGDVYDPEFALNDILEAAMSAEVDQSPHNDQRCKDMLLRGPEHLTPPWKRYAARQGLLDGRGIPRRDPVWDWHALMLRRYDAVSPDLMEADVWRYAEHHGLAYFDSSTLCSDDPPATQPTETDSLLEAAARGEWPTAQPHSSATITPSMGTDLVAPMSEGMPPGEVAPNEGPVLATGFMMPTSGQPVEMMAMAGSQLTSMEAAQNVFTDVSNDVREITDQATRGTILEVISYLDTSKWSGWMRDNAALNSLAGGSPEYQVEMHGPATNGGSVGFVWLPYTPRTGTLDIPSVCHYPRIVHRLGGSNTITLALEDSKLAPRVRSMDEFFEGAGGNDTPSIVMYIDQPLNNGVNPGTTNTIKITYVIRARFGALFRMGRARRAGLAGGVIGKTLREICQTSGLRMMSGSGNNNWPLQNGVVVSPEDWSPPGFLTPIRGAIINQNSNFVTTDGSGVFHPSAVSLGNPGFPNLMIQHFNRVSGAPEAIPFGLGTSGISDTKIFANRGLTDPNWNVATYINKTGAKAGTWSLTIDGQLKSADLLLKRVDFISNGQASFVIQYYISATYGVTVDGATNEQNSVSASAAEAAWRAFFAAPTTYTTNFAQQYSTGFPNVKSVFFSNTVVPITGTLSLPPLHAPNMALRTQLSNQVAKFVDKQLGNQYINLLSWAGYLYVNWTSQTASTVDIDDFVCTSVQAANPAAIVPITTVPGATYVTTATRASMAHGVTFRGAKPRGMGVDDWRKLRASVAELHLHAAYAHIVDKLQTVGYSVEEANIYAAWGLQTECLIAGRSTVPEEDYPGVEFAAAVPHSGVGAVVAGAASSAIGGAASFMGDWFVSKRDQKFWMERAKVSNEYAAALQNNKLTREQQNALEKMQLQHDQATAMINQQANGRYMQDKSTAMSANAATQVEHNAPRVNPAPRRIDRVPNEPPAYDMNNEKIVHYQPRSVGTSPGDSISDEKFAHQRPRTVSTASTTASEKERRDAPRMEWGRPVEARNTGITTEAYNAAISRAQPQLDNEPEADTMSRSDGGSMRSTSSSTSSRISVLQ